MYSPEALISEFFFAYFVSVISFKVLQKVTRGKLKCNWLHAIVAGIPFTAINAVAWYQAFQLMNTPEKNGTTTIIALLIALAIPLSAVGVLAAGAKLLPGFELKNKDLRRCSGIYLGLFYVGLTPFCGPVLLGLLYVYQSKIQGARFRNNSTQYQSVHDIFNPNSDYNRINPFSPYRNRR
jgi:hypothetical protein